MRCGGSSWRRPWRGREGTPRAPPAPVGNGGARGPDGGAAGAPAGAAGKEKKTEAPEAASPPPGPGGRRPVRRVDGDLDGIVEKRIEAGAAEDADRRRSAGGRAHAILLSVFELLDDESGVEDEDDEDEDDESEEEEEEDELDSFSFS